jgi:ABC-type transporter Mla maintaining outer membrane lipid asymmetry ATPase subunit MlaF
MPVRLNVEEVTFGEGREMLLRRIDLAVEPGETVIICGRSGCGKSTFLEIIAGLKRPLHGKVLWDDTDITSLSRKELLAARHRIGYVFQRHALIANYSVFENIALPLRVQSEYSGNEIRDRVHTILEEVALFNVDLSFPEALSVGQLKSASIARALVVDPEILFLDEPLSGLDPQTAAGIKSVLAEQQREKRRTIVTAGHEMELWTDGPGRTLFLEGGKLVSLTEYRERLRSAGVTI